MRSTLQSLQPQGLFMNKPFYTSTAFTQALLLNKPCFYTKAFLHKTCFYANPVFTQALSLHKHCFYTKAFLHKTCFYANPVFTQALSLHKHCFYTKAFLHKTCFYTNAVFTQALSLHKHCFYTRPAFTQKRFYTRPAFTQTLSLRKLCHYTSIAFIQALHLHNDILLTKAFCNLQTGNRLEGRRNAEGCKYRTQMQFVCNKSQRITVLFQGQPKFAENIQPLQWCFSSFCRWPELKSLTAQLFPSNGISRMLRRFACRTLTRLASRRTRYGHSPGGHLFDLKNLKAPRS